MFFRITKNDVGSTYTKIPTFGEGRKGVKNEKVFVLGMFVWYK